MKTLEDAERLEKVTGQLLGVHAEIEALAKKTPNNSPNKFKLDLINNILVSANAVLGANYRPVDGFEQFNPDDAPTVSDVAMILGQYLEEAERFRSDNVEKNYSGWWYVLDGQVSSKVAAQPRKLTRK
ncbi:hypothetical protein FZ934_04290 [Rhizobium grahamii]|uniref:Uncharacterized protein n=1 Tax=Rhizobium grahamii TaxID=1120045 RepID=A0A5Q0C1H7_9HYPH|nr:MULTISPECIES: hypothetical protein [Rhizobium]QFY59718.1 hypothetical protein FZ934_04290 [Rhizobium grahamii]QRM51169.1 hypothetical protein F3Y33_18600 [Rhizobium sp. BG6]